MDPTPIIHRHSRFARLIIWAMGRPFLFAFVICHKLGLLNRMKSRVRAIITHGNYVLLVREAADFNRWSVPGGGMKPGEAPAHALSREMGEELGLTIPDNSFELVGTYAARAVQAPHNIIVFRAVVDNNQHIRLQYEILDAAWWRLDDLPVNLSPGARVALQEYF